MTVKEEVLEAILSLQNKQVCIGIDDIVEEVKRNRILRALTELENEGKVVYQGDGKWTVKKK